MRIGEVMTRRVETIGPEDPAEAAYERMQVRRIRHLVVVEGKALVGVISERDLGGRAGAVLRRGRKVADLMNRDVTIAAPHDTVRAAANRMRGSSLGCLPVVEGGRLVGLLTVSDVLSLVGRGVQKPIELEERKVLRRRGPKRDAAPRKLARSTLVPRPRVGGRAVRGRGR